MVARGRPDLARKLGLLPLGLPGDSLDVDSGGPPALDPNSLPDTVTAEEVEQGKVQDLPDEELQRILRLLPQWQPKRHQDEYGFHDSFERFLVKQGGYAPGDFRR